jgi:formylglycine-generating enzyme required for sulfatase activity
MSAKRRFACLRTALGAGYLGPLTAVSLMFGVTLAGCLRLNWSGQAMTSLPGDGFQEDEPGLLPLADTSAAPEKKAQSNSIGMTMVWIPPGEFIMGSPADRSGCSGAAASTLPRDTRDPPTEATAFHRSRPTSAASARPATICDLAAFAGRGERSTRGPSFAVASTGPLLERTARASR